jgi:alpha-mannosidase
MITNMYVGHNFMKKEFGVTSKVGFQLDPFGHSSAYAALLADFGFEALILTRVEERLKEDLLNEESSHFLWRPFSKHFGNQK